MTSNAAAPELEHLASMFAHTVASHPSRPATRVLATDSPTGWGRRDGEWLIQTWTDMAGRVDDAARSLIDADVAPGDRVLLFANNCPEWTIVDLACQQVGAIVVPVYATSTVDQIRHILTDSGATVAFTGSDSETSRVLDAVTDGQPRLVVSLAKPANSDVAWFVDFCATPSPDSVAELAARAEKWSGDDIATIVYTSGTTGAPRGVMLSNAGFLAQNRALEVFFAFGPEEHSLAFLPLSHALERAWTCYVMSRGAMNTYCPNARLAAEMLVKARPTLLVSVPRLFEKVVSTAKDKVRSSPLKSRIFEWALRVGGQMQHANRKGKRPRLYWRAQFALADRLVFSSIRDAMGGPKKVLACGGAPLRVDVEEFFSAVGIPIFPGYGLTEAGPLVTFNAPGEFKVGTVGRVMHGGELRIADESEICYRGPNVMVGYWGDPQGTEEAFVTTDDGGPWLRTGDAGYVDVDGYLVITDRLKDIIVTSGGKNVAPQQIEGLLMSDPLFEQAVLLGDNRPYLTLLVKPSLPDLSEIAERLSLSNLSLPDQLSNPAIIDEVRARAKKLTDKLPSHEQFKDLRVLLEDFTLENGLLTPTLKVRRREVEKRFAQVIEDMYNSVVDFAGRHFGSDENDGGPSEGQDDKRPGAQA